MSKSDPFVSAWFDSIRDAERQFSAEEGGDRYATSKLSPKIPLLLRIVSPTWRFRGGGFHEQFRLGSIVGCAATSEAVRNLEDDLEVISIEVSRPMDDAGDGGPAITTVRADPVHRPPHAEQGDSCLSGFIDGGIDVLHHAFRDENGDCRVLAVWDQRDLAGPPPSGFSYGRLYDQTAIRAICKSGKLPASWTRESTRHGTHVASIAAGRSTTQFSGGMAPSSPIVFVIPQMRVSPGDPYSLGYSVSHLDGLRFLRGFARERSRPIVINVSLGMNAGAHDGSSLLEAGFDEITSGGRVPGCVIVKSAGNERQWDGHARLWMGPYSTDSFNWDSDNKIRTVDQIEAWFEPTAEVQAKLVDPSGDTTSWVGHASPLEKYVFAATGNRAQIQFTRFHKDNGSSRFSVLVLPGPGGQISPGHWSLELSSQDVLKRCRIDAWIERDESHALRFLSHLDEEYTLSIPATAQSVISVAATTDDPSPRVFSASSHGPTRDERSHPTLSAPGVQIQAASATSGTGIESMSGTSMACPHVTGAVALLLSRWEKLRGKDAQLNAVQVRSALQRSAQHTNGQWTPDRGYGMLDAAALLATLT